MAAYARWRSGRADCARDTADDPRHEQPEKEWPVDIAMKQMTKPRGAGGENLDDMDARRRRGWRDAQYRDEQRVTNHAKRHAQRAIHQLGGDSHGEENPEVGIHVHLAN